MIVMMMQMTDNPRRNGEQIDGLPDSLKYLKINVCGKLSDFITITKLPNSLEQLILTNSCFIDFGDSLSKCQNLIHLEACMIADILDEKFYPPNLKRLFLNDIESEAVKYLPRSLTHIISGFESLNPGDLPPGLVSLIIKHSSSSFNQEILPGTFPESLQRLSIWSEFNHILNKENLPKKLLSLKLGSKFAQDLNDLPDSIMELVLPFGYDKPLTNLPKSLYHLKLDMKLYQDVKFDVPVLEDLESIGYEEELKNWSP